MPFDGIISEIETYGGILNRETGEFKQSGIVIPDPLHPNEKEDDHIATFTFKISLLNSSEMDSIILKIHVGKPTYITDTIHFNKKVLGKNAVIKIGTVIGEIILGSRCELFLSKSHFSILNSLKIRNGFSKKPLEDIQRKDGDDLLGGETKLAIFKK